MVIRFRTASVLAPVTRQFESEDSEGNVQRFTKVTFRSIKQWRMRSNQPMRVTMVSCSGRIEL